MRRGPSEAVLRAAWLARRCADCADPDVIAVLLPPDDDTGEISLCMTHFLARMASPMLAQISALRCD